MTPVDRSELTGDAPAVAVRLLNKLLVTDVDAVSGADRKDIAPVERSASGPRAAGRTGGRAAGRLAGRTVGRIVEVEAYTEDDPASHTFRGRTPRNATMYEEPGRLYAYLSYGIHVCANVVCSPAGVGAAVLVRAVVPVIGADVMEARRGRGGRELANGPGKLCQALGITLDHDGIDLCDAAAPVRLLDDGTPPPETPLVTPRIGISVATDVPWRFLLP